MTLFFNSTSFKTITVNNGFKSRIQHDTTLLYRVADVVVDDDDDDDDTEEV